MNRDFEPLGFCYVCLGMTTHDEQFRETCAALSDLLGPPRETGQSRTRWRCRINDRPCWVELEQLGERCMLCIRGAHGAAGPLANLCFTEVRTPVAATRLLKNLDLPDCAHVDETPSRLAS